MSHIAVVDLGTGNLHSVGKALQKVTAKQRIVITSDPNVITSASHVVLPGQGAMGSWFRALDEHDLRAAVVNALSTCPVLGICLGLQALYSHSDEDGGTTGLGIMSGNVRKFPINQRLNNELLKVPHMGWNRVQQCFSHPLWTGIEDGIRFYFVHSYYAYSDMVSEIAALTNYGLSFVSAAAHSNVFAVQFHPEKSHEQGLMLLHNFVCWNGES
ncbi:MAG: imidazole glycerol phosphate synthase subunit HisH [Acidiferrobacteraceae bacterium]|nr:imidazole glycerol phosphate synthase subunit HisH [Acidiferrobacteraceae bacterium]